MNILDALRSAAASLLHRVKVFATGLEVAFLGARLARLERVSQTFTTRTGQTVESREVVELRKHLAARREAMGAAPGGDGREIPLRT
jgi:hypothetical protein